MYPIGTHIGTRELTLTAPILESRAFGFEYTKYPDAFRSPHACRISVPSVNVLRIGKTVLLAWKDEKEVERTLEVPGSTQLAWGTYCFGTLTSFLPKDRHYVIFWEDGGFHVVEPGARTKPTVSSPTLTLREESIFQQAALVFQTPWSDKVYRCLEIPVDQYSEFLREGDDVRISWRQGGETKSATISADTLYDEQSLRELLPDGMLHLYLPEDDAFAPA